MNQTNGFPHGSAVALTAEFFQNPGADPIVDLSISPRGVCPAGLGSTCGKVISAAGGQSGTGCESIDFVLVPNGHQLITLSCSPLLGHIRGPWLTIRSHFDGGFALVGQIDVSAGKAETEGGRRWVA